MNFLLGTPSFFSRLRKAEPNGQPITFQNSATLIRVGSIFNAAPIDEKKVAFVLVAVCIKCTLLARLSIPSMIKSYPSSSNDS